MGKIPHLLVPIQMHDATTSCVFASFSRSPREVFGAFVQKTLDNASLGKEIIMRNRNLRLEFVRTIPSCTTSTLAESTPYSKAGMCTIELRPEKQEKET
jgi:hypothetical protein